MTAARTITVKEVRSARDFSLVSAGRWTPGGTSGGSRGICLKDVAHLPLHNSQGECVGYVLSYAFELPDRDGATRVS